MVKLTPPLGWNSWNTFAQNINETVVRETADAMVETGLKDAGYEYVVIDDCWQEKERDAEGNLTYDKEVQLSISIGGIWGHGNATAFERLIHSGNKENTMVALRLTVDGNFHVGQACIKNFLNSNEQIDQFSELYFVQTFF